LLSSCPPLISPHVRPMSVPSHLVVLIHGLLGFPRCSSLLLRAPTLMSLITLHAQGNEAPQGMRGTSKNSSAIPPAPQTMSSRLTVRNRRAKWARFWCTCPSVTLSSSTGTHTCTHTCCTEHSALSHGLHRPHLAPIRTTPLPGR
jgi:hypothetical protein